MNDERHISGEVERLRADINALRKERDAKVAAVHRLMCIALAEADREAQREVAALRAEIRRLRGGEGTNDAFREAP